MAVRARRHAAPRTWMVAALAAVAVIAALIVWLPSAPGNTVPIRWAQTQSLYRLVCGSPPEYPEGRWPSACWRPYSNQSPFNLRVPEDPPLHPDSETVVRTLSGWGPPQNLLAGHADTSEDFYHPVYWSRPSDPEYTVHCVKFSRCEIEGMRVRIPSAARPTGGGDGHLAVIDQADGWEYDFWQVRSKPPGGGTIVVSHGGRTRIDGDGLGSNATAAWFGLAAGAIRAGEMRTGVIDHALFATMRCSSGESVYPAQPGTSGAACADFSLPDVGAPPMGARLWLDMSEEEIGRLDVPDWKRTILRAMARYGMIVGDTSAGNGSWGVQGESGSSYTSFGADDPWRAFAESVDAPRYRDGYFFDLADGVDWRDRLRVLDPCVSRRTC